jgi:hypothetical protein
MKLSVKTIRKLSRGKHKICVGNNSITFSSQATKLFPPGHRVSFEYINGRMRLMLDESEGFQLKPSGANKTLMSQIHSKALCGELKKHTKRSFEIGEFSEGGWPLYPTL